MGTTSEMRNESAKYIWYQENKYIDWEPNLINAGQVYNEIAFFSNRKMTRSGLGTIMFMNSTMYWHWSFDVKHKGMQVIYIIDGYMTIHALDYLGNTYDAIIETGQHKWCL